MTRLTCLTFLAASLSVAGLACAQGCIGTGIGRSNAKIDCSDAINCVDLLTLDAAYQF